MSPETQWEVLVRLLTAQAHAAAAIELVEADIGACSVLEAVAVAQAELRAAQQLLVDCQVQFCLESLTRRDETLSAIAQLSALSRAVLNVR
jgi:hypothetical protein